MFQQTMVPSIWGHYETLATNGSVSTSNGSQLFPWHSTENAHREYEYVMKVNNIIIKLNNIIIEGNQIILNLNVINIIYKLKDTF